MTKQILDTETQVCEDIKNRQQLGITKYGTTVASNPLELRQWLQHTYEEKLDDAVYMKRAIQELDKIIDAGVASSINVDQIMAQVTSSLGSKLSQLSNLDIDSIIPKRCSDSSFSVFGHGVSMPFFLEQT